MFHLVEWSVIVSRLSLIFSPLYKAVVTRRHLPRTSSPMPQRVSPRCQACRQTSAPLRRPRTHNCPGVVGITWRLRMTTGRLKRTAPEKGFRIDIISMKWNLIYQDELILLWFNMHIWHYFDHLVSMAAKEHLWIILNLPSHAVPMAPLSRRAARGFPRVRVLFFLIQSIGGFTTSGWDCFYPSLMAKRKHQLFTGIFWNCFISPHF